MRALFDFKAFPHPRRHEYSIVPAGAELSTMAPQWKARLGDLAPEASKDSMGTFSGVSEKYLEKSIEHIQSKSS